MQCAVQRKQGKCQPLLFSVPVTSHPSSWTWPYAGSQLPTLFIQTRPRKVLHSTPVCLTAALTCLSPENTANTACLELGLCFLVNCLHVLSPRMAGTQPSLA